MPKSFDLVKIRVRVKSAIKLVCMEAESCGDESRSVTSSGWSAVCESDVSPEATTRSNQ